MSVYTLIIVAAHAGLLAFAWWRRAHSRGNLYWLFAVLGFGTLASATYLLPADLQIGTLEVRGVVLMLCIIAMLTAYSGLLINDMIRKDAQTRLRQIIFGIGAAWAIGLVAAAIVTESAQVGQSDWLILLLDSPDATSIIGAVGIVLFSLGLIILGLREFYVAILPEVANRALYWVLDTATLTLATILISSGNDILAAVGMPAFIATLAGAVYASTYHRVFDIRSGIIRSLRTLSFVSLGTALIMLGAYLMLSTNVDEEAANGLLVMFTTALIIATLLVPLRQMIDFLIDQLTIKRFVNPAEATREYSQRVTEAVELSSLVKEVVESLNRVMRVRRSCLILLNSTYKVKDSVELLVMQPGGKHDKTTGFLSVHSPLYATLAAQKVPVSQFDIEYDPAYTDMDTQERQFFRNLAMSAYAPIIFENALIGVLAAGPMLNDTAFYPRDLQLLTTFAQQTGVALRNARLLDDLQHLNKSMQSLNKGLKTANAQMNQLDSVKTDFVTIASHELRTPLAQIRGYTDIIDQMNDQGMLDQTQTTSLVANLRKATERMEELIAAMLDVSQLDVNAMDLSLTETPPESLLRMAIEPLGDAITQRKLSLTARGLRGLPNIQADLQRLVQAFRNIIVNAIKFTPDGGRIEITGTLEESEDEGGVDFVLIAIKDTGVGINKKDLTLVFRKFFRAYDPSLHSTGTYKFLGAGPGLGLTIAKGVIEGHGGKIWVESEKQDMESYPGATFYIRLPVSTPDDAKRVMRIETERERDKPTHLKSPQVTEGG